MTKKLFYFFFICLMTAFAAEPANAQKWLKNAGKGLQRATSVTPAAASAGVKTAGTAARMESAVTRAIAASHPHLYIGGQRLTGTSKITAIRKTLDAGYQPHRFSPRPTLSKNQSFAAADFTAVAPTLAEITTDKTVFPFQNQRGLIYRGLALNADGQAIRNILENGLLIKDLGKFASDYITSVGGEVTRGLSHSIKATNLTADSSEAVGWAKRRSKEGEIAVVMAVKYSSNKGAFSVDRHAINTSRDIPTEEIYAMTALLNINGTRTWCKVELEGDGFRVTPYEPVAE